MIYFWWQVTKPGEEPQMGPGPWVPGHGKILYPWVSHFQGTLPLTTHPHTSLTQWPANPILPRQTRVYSYTSSVGLWDEVPCRGPGLGVPVFSASCYLEGSSKEVV